jgi:hypothetical protein
MRDSTGIDSISVEPMPRPFRRLLDSQAEQKLGMFLFTDLNPIELAFGKLKAHLRKAAEHTIPGLLRRIGRVVKGFGRRECKNFLRHAAYVQA